MSKVLMSEDQWFLDITLPSIALCAADFVVLVQVIAARIHQYLSTGLIRRLVATLLHVTDLLFRNVRQPVDRRPCRDAGRCVTSPSETSLATQSQ